MSWIDYTLPSGQVVQLRRGEGFDIVGTDATISEIDAWALGKIAERSLLGQTIDPGQSGHTFSPQGAQPAQETPKIGAPETPVRPLPDKSGRSVDGRRMCVEGNAWFCGGSAKYGCAAEGCRAPEAPAVKTGYSCYWFARRDRDYFCDQGEGHQTPHHNVNVPDGATWIDWPPDGVWLDSDGIPGPPVAKKP